MKVEDILMELKDLRKNMDEIDEKLVSLFCERMSTAAQIAEYKREKEMPVMDASREREKLASVSELAGDEMSDYITVLYSLLFELSRAYQGKILGLSSETPKESGKGNRRNGKAVSSKGFCRVPGRGRRVFSACLRKAV